MATTPRTVRLSTLTATALAMAGLMGAARTFEKPFRLKDILAAVEELTAKPQ